VVTAATARPIHLPSFPSATIEEQVALHDNPVYGAVPLLPLATLGFLGYFVFALGELLRTALASRRTTGHRVSDAAAVGLRDCRRMAVACSD
jgi:hypothetical protein